MARGGKKRGGAKGRARRVFETLADLNAAKRRAAREQEQERRPGPGWSYAPVERDTTTALKIAFLEEFARSRSISVACHAIQRARSTVMQWKSEDPDFRRAWVDIWGGVIDQLETSLMTKAIEGYERPVYQGGRLIGAEVVHHPQLGMFLLERNRPEQYGRDARVGVSPEDYAAQVRAALADQDDEARRALAEEPVRKKG